MVSFGGAGGNELVAHPPRKWQIRQPLAVDGAPAHGGRGGIPARPNRCAVVVTPGQAETARSICS